MSTIKVYRMLWSAKRKEAKQYCTTQLAKVPQKIKTYPAQPRKKFPELPSR